MTDSDIDAAIGKAIRDFRPIPTQIDLDDVRQDVWVRLLESDFDRDHAQAFSYVCRTTENLIRTLIDAPRMYDHLEDTADERADLDRFIDTEEEIWDLARAYESISRLPKGVCRILRWRFTDGLSIAEIARKLKIPRQTLSRRLAGWLGSLRDSLQEGSSDA